MKIAGLVLAGGRSLRFGGEKAVACFRGEPLIAHAVRVLANGSDRVAINATSGSGAAAWAEAQNLPVVVELAAHAGPLFGVLAGLRWAATAGLDLLVTIPCDLPLLPSDFVRRLAGSGEEGSVACAADGAVQPLCAAWPVGVADEIAAELARGHPPARGLVERADLRRIHFSEPLAFWNINRPADLTM